MITCKDCIHHDLCADCYESERDTGDFDKYLPYEAEDCVFFKDKANFAEVVRCKDCKRFMEYTEEYRRDVEGADGDCYLRIVCSSSLNEQLNAVQYDDFCSYGKRKEGENDEYFC